MEKMLIKIYCWVEILLIDGETSHFIFVLICVYLNHWRLMHCIFDLLIIRSHEEKSQFADRQLIFQRLKQRLISDWSSTTSLINS